jgi:alpha-L-fucosidase 2
MLWCGTVLLLALAPIQHPGADAVLSGLQLKAPISTWDEALPLGNGEVGALVWGSDHTLKISLDRGDIWDLKHAPEISEAGFTYANLQSLVAKGNADEVGRLFDKPYERPTPTKLPGFRLEMDLAPDVTAEQFDLNFRDGVGTVGTNRGLVHVVFDRNAPVLLGEADAPVARFRFVPPTILKSLGYPDALLGSEKNDLWIQQSNRDRLTYVACLAQRQVKGRTFFAVSFVTNAHDVDALKRARGLANKALKEGFDRAATASRRWWDAFWGISQVHVPDVAIQQQYDLAMYLYGSGAKRGQPPIPLQGLWTADDGGLPPWKGDFHHDLNTQLIYWPYLEAGHYEQGLGLLDFLWKQLPSYRRFAHDFFNAQGAAIPGVAALDGTPLGGWAMYSASVTMGPWLSLAFVDHWRTTQDNRFLATRAYPFCKELGDCVRVLLHKGADGRLALALSSSPEIHDNELRAYLKPMSNFDLALLKRFFSDLSQMALALGKTKEAKDWASLSQGFGDLWTDETGLKLSQNEDLTESHRHFSHLMSIHPLGLISVEGPQADKKVITDSLAHIKKLGTSEWCGYSFSWIACMYARCAMPDEALKALSIYASAFVLRNGFHANGDQTDKGYSNFRYRPFTLEGNFAAAQAVHEMLMQSWHGTIRLFPATPWPSASFSNLRAEGGFVVSAERLDGRLKSAVIRATAGGHLVVKTAEKVSWETPEGVVETQRLDFQLKAGQAVHVR